VTAPPNPPAGPERERQPSPVRFGTDGLIPAVIQDAETNAVLMVGFMNEEALRLTRATGKVHFWSRSRAKLWRKGATSGHEQLVDAVYVNCEQNSLLVTVRQVGAACHDGYPTCYYRRLEPDDRLTLVAERVFDPSAVYGPNRTPVATISIEPQLDARSMEPPAPSARPEPPTPPRHPERSEGPAPAGRSPAGRLRSASTPVQPSHTVEASATHLATASRLQFGAYEHLRENDLTAVSRTSVRLRADEDTAGDRIADELRELAGVLDGSHRHQDLAADVHLEGGQVLYWVILAALRAGGTWERLRPDRALPTTDPELSLAMSVAMLRAEADAWSGDGPTSDVVAHCHATLALIGQACCLVGVDPLSIVEADLSELRTRSYLAPYFDDAES
jgi:phosphoribosyl-AMP cyclohydrolase